MGIKVYQCIFYFQPQKKMQKKLREMFYSLYSHLDNQINDSKAEVRDTSLELIELSGINKVSLV